MFKGFVYLFYQPGIKQALKTCPLPAKSIWAKAWPKK